MPASSGLENGMGTGPTQFAWNGQPGSSPSTTPPPEAPYVPLLDEETAAYADINANFVILNDLISWLRTTGAVKTSA